MSAPLPLNEKERLEALYRYKILDTDPEQIFNDLCMLASHICQAPIALVSLVDRDRQWFKAKIGVEQTEASRDIAFCAHAILQKGTMIVSDAAQDPRFSQNPLVTMEPRIRFYAGTPLITRDGFPLGTLCVFDRTPRDLTTEQRECLDAIGRQVMSQLELRRTAEELRLALAAQERVQIQLHETENRFFQFLDALPIGVFVLDSPGNPFYVNQAAKKILGRGIQPNATAEDLADTYRAFIAGTNEEYPAERMPVVRALKGETSTVTDMEIHRSNRVIPVQIWGAPIYDSECKVAYAIVAFSDITERVKVEKRLRAQYAVTLALEEAESLAQAAPALLRAVCESVGWRVGVLWLVNKKENHLECVALWHTPESQVKEFESMTRLFRFTPELDLPGRVWASKEPAWIPDVVEDTNFARTPAALNNGLHSGVAFPILVQGEVTGVMEFFSDRIEEPDPDLLEMLRAFGTQIGQYVIRMTVEEQKKRLLKKLADFGSESGK